MKIVLDVPDVHADSGKDMFDFVGELCDKYEIAATMSVIPEPAKTTAPPAYLDFCVVFTGTVGIGVEEDGGWVLGKDTLDSNLGAIIQRALDNGSITTDSNSELLKHNFTVTVKAR